MAATETDSAKRGKTKDTTPLVDTDVHEGIRSLEELLPYVAPKWQSLLTSPGWHWYAPNGTEALPYLAPITHGRAEWLDPDGEAHNTDPELTAQHLFEEEGVSHAVLNGFMHFSRYKTDPEFITAMASAYNDWQIDTWLEKDQRFRGSVHCHAQYPEQAAREIDRAAEHPSMVQVFLPFDDTRQFGDPFYRPIFEAAARNDLAVSFHHSCANKTILGYPRYYVEWHTLAAPQSGMGHATSLLFSGLFDELPELRVILLETGVSWVPWLLFRADQQYREVRANVPWVRRLPSEIFRDNIRVATQPITEVNSRELMKIIELGDLEKVFVFATDYPHYDADSADVIGSLPDDIRNRIRYENAFDAFPRIARDAA